MDSMVYISLAVFIAVIALLVFIRSKTGSKYEVKNSDIMLGLLPIVLILLVSGKIKSFAFGDLKIESAFVEASNKEIEMQVSPLEGIPVRELQSDAKRSVSVIPQLIEKKTEALEFRLGHGGYYGPAIQEYFDQLSRRSLLKYIILKDQDNAFFGMYKAEILLSYFDNNDQGYTTQNLANWLNRSNENQLSGLPGFISSDEALMQTSNKSEALSTMEEQGLDMLPVVNNEGQLQGIVERSRLTTSLILDVTKQLSANTASN